MIQRLRNALVATSTMTASALFGVALVGVACGYLWWFATVPLPLSVLLVWAGAVVLLFAYWGVAWWLTLPQPRLADEDDGWW